MYSSDRIIDEYVGNVKRCVVAVLLATSVSFITNIEYKSVGTTITNVATTRESYDKYSYDEENDTMITNKQWISGVKSTSSNGEPVTIDRVYDKQTLIEKLNSNIGERECVADPNLAVDITDSNIQIVGNTLRMSVVIKNSLPVGIRSFECMAIIHHKGKVVYTIPIKLKDVNIEQYSTYGIDESIKIRNSNEEVRNYKVSLVAAHMQ